MAYIDTAERMGIIAARINKGQDSYAGRLSAWHRLGVVKGEFQTWKDMIESAKAAFEVIKCQLEFGGVPVESWGTFRIDSEIPQGMTPTKKVATDQGEYYLTFLGSVGKDYHVIQHTKGFELLDHLVGSIDGAHYETMGTLDFGRVVWGQVDPNISIRVGDDVSNILLSFHTSHDGSRAFDIYETIERMVCRNTFRAAQLKRLAKALRVRHSKNAENRIKELSAEIDEIRSVAMTMQERLQWLSKRRVTRESMTTILDRLYPPKIEDGKVVPTPKRDNILADILAIYEDNDGNAFPEQRGSAYNLLNSITNHTDHVRASRGDGRAESAVFGSGDLLKTNALNLILEEAEKMPAMPERVVIGSFEEIGLNVN